jgi:hypothetical protein
MAKRIRKSAALPVEQRTAQFRYFLDLPGAVFIGKIASADIDHAVHIGGDEELLWLDCQDVGFESNEIRRFAANPALITNCGYYGAGALSQMR